MLCMQICIILNICIVAHGSLNGKKVIDVDSSHGSARRSRDHKCDLSFFRDYCTSRCSGGKPVCFKDDCYCVKRNLTAFKKILKNPNFHFRTLNRPEDLPPIPSNEELFIDSHPTNFYYEPMIPNSRPIRRHHIAHFCPELELARECLQKCMPQGKTAFCGKGHICYCGHRYGQKNRFHKINSMGMYTQFEDLHEKYYEKPQEEEDDEETYDEVDYEYDDKYNNEEQHDDDNNDNKGHEDEHHDEGSVEDDDANDQNVEDDDRNYNEANKDAQ